MLRDEFGSLKRRHRDAIKVEKACPWSQKASRTAERETVEAELGRLRTKLDRMDRERVESKVLKEAKSRERSLQEAGKRAWFMKTGERHCQCLDS